MAGVYYHADPLEQLELAGHQQSQSSLKKRQRQTRIPEHLKAVKKGSKNDKNMSAKVSKTSSGSAASSPRKNGGSTPKPAAAAAARAGSEYTSTKNKLQQVIEAAAAAAAANGNHPDRSVLSLVFSLIQFGWESPGASIVPSELIERVTSKSHLFPTMQKWIEHCENLMLMLCLIPTPCSSFPAGLASSMMVPSPRSC
jgi:hypothetical protein